MSITLSMGEPYKAVVHTPSRMAITRAIMSMMPAEWGRKRLLRDDSYFTTYDNATHVSFNVRIDYYQNGTAYTTRRSVRIDALPEELQAVRKAFDL